MDLQFWAPILIPLVLGAVGTALAGGWRWWRHDEGRELRRIYRGAVQVVTAGPVRDELVRLISDDDFQEWLDPPEAQPPARERAHIRALLRARLGEPTAELAEPALRAYFRRVHRGLAGAHNQRWKDRAQAWDVAPTDPPAATGTAGTPALTATTGPSTTTPPTTTTTPPTPTAPTTTPATTTAPTTTAPTAPAAAANPAATVVGGWNTAPPPLVTSGPATIGRDDEQAAVTALLRDGGVRLVTLTGPGGVGKTRLGRDVAAACADDFSGRVYWADLSTISAGESFRVAAVLARTLGVQPSADQLVATPADQDGRPDSRVQVWLDAIVAAVGDERLLVVVDNFEQVTEAAGQVTQLLDRCPELRMLATSRRPLRLVGLEYEYPVPPLPLPDPTALPGLDELLRYPAIALFVERARQRRPDFVLTAEQAPAVAEICQQLDGLPYMIEVAGALLKYYGNPVNLRQELLGLDRRLSLATLVNRASTMAPRQRDGLAMIAWSYDLLGVEEQRLFRRLGAFVGEFDLAAAAAVGAAQRTRAQARASLELLIDDNLVQPVAAEAAGPVRYRLLETTRECAHLILT
ncbi:MAG TPA: AAA family ATPase, partial [Catenuloplanes sp.]